MNGTPDVLAVTNRDAVATRLDTALPGGATHAASLPAVKGAGGTFDAVFVDAEWAGAVDAIRKADDTHDTPIAAVITAPNSPGGAYVAARDAVKAGARLAVNVHANYHPQPVSEVVRAAASAALRLSPPLRATMIDPRTGAARRTPYGAAALLAGEGVLIDEAHVDPVLAAHGNDVVVADRDGGVFWAGTVRRVNNFSAFRKLANLRVLP